MNKLILILKAIRESASIKTLKTLNITGTALQMPNSAIIEIYKIIIKAQKTFKIEVEEGTLDNFRIEEDLGTEDAKALL